jgi:hypothetical protein
VQETQHRGQVAGQLFCRDQYMEMVDSVLARADDPYVVVVGPSEMTRDVVGALPDRFTRLGDVFDPSVVDLGVGHDGAVRGELGGLGRHDTAIRDMHPALFLMRLRARCPGVPVLSWSPSDQPRLLEAVLRDPQALVLACLPATGDQDRDRLHGDDVEASLAACGFRSSPWFDDLAQALRRIRDERLEAGGGTIVHPVPPGGASPTGPVADPGRPATNRVAPVWDGLRRLRRRWVERRSPRLGWRDRAAGRQLELVQDRAAAIAPGEILLVTCLRNELARMPAFVSYYRRLGVSHFLVVDNGSTDGFPDWAAGQPDMSVWRTEASYKDAEFGMLWVNDLLRRYGRGHWCVVVDPDEFVVYPDIETRDLAALTTALDGNRQPCMPALLLDTYSDKPLAETVLAFGDDPFSICPYFDRDGYVQSRGWGDGTWIRGGPRLRAHFHDRPTEAPALNKIPLIRWKRGYHYRSSTHDVYPRRLNRTRTEREAAITAALCHFKLVATLEDKASEEANRGQHYGSGREYARYRQAGGEAVFMVPGISVRFEDSGQLARLGLISAAR